MHRAPVVPSAPEWSSFSWPRTYRVGGFGAALLYAFAAALLVGGAVAVGALLRTDGLTSAQVGLLALAGVASLAFGAALLVEVRRAHYTLSRDAVVSESLFGSRTLRRDEIAGYRRMVHNGITTYQLVPSVAGRRGVDLSPFAVVTDEAFLPWIHSLPDLAEVAIAAERAEALADPALGVDVAAREARLAQARRIATALNWATLAVGAWALVHPAPYCLATALCALLPWVALALVGHAPEAFSLAEAPTGVRGSLALPFLIPGAVLGLRLGLDVPLVAWTSAIGPTTVALCVLLMGHDLATRARPPSMSDRLAVALLGLGWAYGAAALVNVAFDRGAPWTYARVRVVDRHVSRGKATTWHLTVDPWGARRERSDVQVGRAHYEASPIGGAVCIAWQRGALRMAHYWVTGERCRATTR